MNGGDNNREGGGETTPETHPAQLVSVRTRNGAEGEGGGREGGR